MKKILAALLWMGLTLSQVHASLTTLDASSPIVFSTQADGRNWKLGYNAKNDQMTLIEYVVEGESLENWTELVSVMATWPSDLSLDQYFDAFASSLKKLIPENKIHTRVIERRPNTLLAEWWLDDKSPNSQHEWIQLFKDQSTVYSLRYTTKNLDTVETKRPVWEKILSEAKIRSPRTRY